MTQKIIVDKQDLTYLKWSHARNSSGTAGTFLKSQSVISGEKIYYKLSNYDSEKGIVGHECINEIIVDRLLTILGVEHLEYQLIHADIEIDGKIHETWLCASKDFKNIGETKSALDNYYQINKKLNETRYEFCVNHGWQKYIDTMLVVDYLILNRDRHGANIEVLRNGRKHTIRIAPLFDHGLSLLCSCYSEEELDEWKKTHKGSYDLLRAKGLGELNAEDLQKVCFLNERYKRITISDIEQSTALLNILQGPSVEPRKKFIYENATELGFNFD